MRKGDKVFAAVVGWSRRGETDPLEVGEATVVAVRKDGSVQIDQSGQAFGFRVLIRAGDFFPSRREAVSSLLADRAAHLEQLRLQVAATEAWIARHQHEVAS